MNKKIGIIALSGVLLLTACGKKEDNALRGNGEVPEVSQEVSEQAQNDYEIVEELTQDELAEMIVDDNQVNQNQQVLDPYDEANEQEVGSLGTTEFSNVDDQMEYNNIIDVLPDEDLAPADLEQRESERELENYMGMLEEENSISIPTQEQFRSFFGARYTSLADLNDKVRASGKPALVVFGNDLSEITRIQGNNMRTIVQTLGNRVELFYVQTNAEDGLVTSDMGIQDVYPIREEGGAVVLGTNAMPVKVSEEQNQFIQNQGLSTIIINNNYNYPVFMFQSVPSAPDLNNFMDYMGI